MSPSARASSCLVLVLLLGLAPAYARAQSGNVAMLADSTVLDSWKLENGLEVRTRHVPRTSAVAITLGYRVGSDQDPANREGLAQLLGLLNFTAPAGDVPERSTEEMDSQRPLGWSFPVSRRSTLFTEVATRQQFPGVLSQMAARMRGVEVTPQGLKAAVKQVQREMGEQLFGSPDQSLYFQSREVALGHTDEVLLRRASAKALESIPVREVQDHFKRLYVPANAVLSIAGDLEGIDVHRLIDGLFADLPAGTAQAEAPGAPLQPKSRIVMRSQIPGPIGVVGVLAPALEDTLHPAFYLTVLLMGSHLTQTWPVRPGETSARHQFSVLDEPELVRFYPPLRNGENRTELLGERLQEAVEDLKAKIVPRSAWDDLRNRTSWQLGGAMPPNVIETVRRSPILLHNLSRSAASRVLWGGDAFWEEYRRRFETSPTQAGRWYDWFVQPDKQVRLLYNPRG